MLQAMVYSNNLIMESHLGCARLQTWEQTLIIKLMASFVEIDRTNRNMITSLQVEKVLALRHKLPPISGRPLIAHLNIGLVERREVKERPSLLRLYERRPIWTLNPLSRWFLWSAIRKSCNYSGKRKHSNEGPEIKHFSWHDTEHSIRILGFKKPPIPPSAKASMSATPGMSRTATFTHNAMCNIRTCL